MKIKRKKRETAKFSYDIRKLLFDKRLNISMLSKQTGLSRFILILARDKGTVSPLTLQKLKEVFPDAENYLLI